MNKTVAYFSTCSRNIKSHSGDISWSRQIYYDFIEFSSSFLMRERRSRMPNGANEDDTNEENHFSENVSSGWTSSSMPHLRTSPMIEKPPLLSGSPERGGGAPSAIPSSSQYIQLSWSETQLSRRRRDTFDQTSVVLISHPPTRLVSQTARGRHSCSELIRIT